MKKRCIFSLLIKVDRPFSSTFKEQKAFNIIYDEKYPIFYGYFAEIKQMHMDYAEYCDAEYILFERDDQYNDFESICRKRYHTPTTFDVIQYYKIYLCEKLSLEYEEVLYIDFDVIPGNIKKNFFDQWDFNKGLIIKNEYFNVTDYKTKQLDSSRLIKAYLASDIAKKMQFYNFNTKNVPHMNTGIIGCNKNSIQAVNFFTLLPHMIEILDQKVLDLDDNYECVRYSNEIIFTLSYLIYTYPIQPILGEYNIWHKKCNGHNDLKCVLLHCTGKKWIKEMILSLTEHNHRISL